MMKRFLAVLILGSVLALSCGKDACGQPVPAPGPAGLQKAPAIRPLEPVVEVEQELYSYKFANNGARPMWCFGNTCMVRLGDKVFASGLKTLPDYVPLNNVRWTLYQNAEAKWTQVADGGDTHEREPCPLVCFSDGRFFLSTNPNSCKPDQQDGPATPQLLPFDANNPSVAGKPLMPRWNRDLAFHAHTYRSFAADGDKHEMVLFYNIAYDKTYWTFCDSKGQWSSQGEIDFPWGKEYDKPQPVRICYPSVQLKDRAVYFCGMSDIIEPYQAWRDTKRQLTGKEFDYDFRRLFYTWSDDITTGKFHPWVEIASRDKTAGSLYPCDLWAGPDGRVHVLWREQAIDTRLREKFFPDAKQSIALNYAVVRDGKVLLVKAVHQWDEGEKKEQPGRGRFHVTPDGRLLVLYYVSGTSAEGKRVAENRLVEIRADGTLGEPVKVPLAVPMESFFTAGVRGGSAPSMIIDMLGESDGTMRYCRIKLR
jgi:hypothetical protein